MPILGATNRTNLRNSVRHERSAVGALTTGAAATLEIDLGAKHTFTRVAAVKRGAASTAETLVIEVSHNGDDVSPTWVTALAAAGTGLVSSPSSAANMAVVAIPTARWVRISYTNGSGAAQTALVLELTAYEGG